MAGEQLEYLSERVQITWKGGRINRINRIIAIDSDAHLRVLGGAHRASGNFVQIQSGQTVSRNITVKDAYVQLANGGRLLQIGSTSGNLHDSRFENIDIVNEGTSGNDINVGTQLNENLELTRIRGIQTFWATSAGLLNPTIDETTTPTCGRT